MQVRLWHENSPLASVVNLCHNAVTHNIPCNLHFFVNSVDFIGRVLHHARLSPDEVKIVCSTSGTSEQINREKLGGDYSIGIPDKAVRKINFYTSTAFEGCDIYDKQGKIYVVSDGTARHHLLDVSTTIRQIAGRAGRRGIYDYGYVTSTSRGNIDILKEQYGMNHQVSYVRIGFPGALLDIDGPLDIILEEWDRLQPESSTVRKIDIKEYVFKYRMLYPQEKDRRL